MRKVSLFFLLLLSAVTFQLKAQQTLVITGKVTDDKGEALSGVTVSVQQGNAAAATNGKGIYSIKIPVRPNALVFKFLGFITQEIPVETKSILNVVLKPDSKALGEVVVIGYGSRNRRDLTTSVATVDMDDITKAPVRSLDEALAGRVAGVQVNSSDGQPGAAVNIVIRGANSVTQSNSPLVVIDGFPIEGFNLNNLSPAEVESTSVLKDAAATAIYGSRGANGVLVITTKKGKAGDPVITFTTNHNASFNNKRMDLMSPYEFVKYNIERYPRKGPNTPYYYMVDYRGLKESNYEDYYRNYAGADWQEPFFQTGYQQNYDLALRGGNNKTTYAASGNVNTQTGTIINTGYSRYQGRIVLDHMVNDKFKVGINTSYSNIKQYGQGASSGLGGGGGSYILYNVWGYSPIDTLNENQPIQNVTQALNGINDFRFNPILHQKNAVSNDISQNLNFNSYLEYRLRPSLTLRVTGVFNTNNNTRENFNNSNTQYGSLQGFNAATGVNGGITFTKGYNWTNENTLTWRKSFKQGHNVTALGGFTMQGFNYQSYGFSAKLLRSESLGLSGLDEGEINPLPTAASSLWRNASFLSRLSYNYKYRYLIDVSYRADGTSKFAQANHWGYFPSVAISWKFKDEPFLKRNKVISDGKLRASYGLTGNNRGNDFSYRNRFELPNNINYSFNNAYAPLVTTGQNLWGNLEIGNKKIKWETTVQTNLGLDVSFFKNRLALTVDWYDKKTKDLILNADIPLSSGYNKSLINIGSVGNRGIEFTLNTTNIQKKDFSWKSSFNISFNRNKLLALTDGQETLLSFVGWDYKFSDRIPSYVSKVGEPLGLMYGWIWEGNYQYSDFNRTSEGNYILKDEVTTNGNTRANIQPGDIKYKDINGDKIVNASDFTVIGKSLPTHIGGFSNNFTYKRFDLNVFFQWSYGNQIQNTNRYVFEGNALGKMAFQQFSSYVDRWTPENQGSRNYRAGYSGGGYYGDGLSSRTIEDGSYIRLKTVSLGYNMSETLMKKLKVKGARVFVSAQNLFTLTKYSGLDPEVSTFNNVLTGGFDYSAYPRAFTVALGMNLTF